MAPRKGSVNINVSEEFRIKTEKILYSFLQNDTLCYEFPHTLTNTERAWIHNKARTLGLLSKSAGKEPKRFLSVYKQRGSNRKANDIIPLTLTDENIIAIQDFLNKYPLSKDKAEVLRLVKQKDVYLGNNMGHLTNGSIQQPESSLNNDLINFRMCLPIWQMRDQLMGMIVSNQVIIVCGETGSGKTTQLPQFILDYTKSCNEKCRVICTQPRRISAVGVSERVAAERGEKVGQTVGYHIRLESCVGPKTVLIYCTNGVLLRTLMHGDDYLRTFTHVIVDEVHERDRYSDFLLICLRELLVHHPHLRLILMSATMDINSFRKYFNNAPVTFVPGRLHAVREYYLDDVLQIINYESPAMINLKKKKAKKNNANNFSFPTQSPPSNTIIEDTKSVNSELDIEMNDCIAECFETGSDEAFSQLMQLILSEHVSINYQHPDTGYTGLMSAAFHGNWEITEQLLLFGANPNLTSKENFTAFEFAVSRQHITVAELLEAYNKNKNKENVPEADVSEKQLTDLYLSTISDAVIDFELLHALLYSIHINNSNFGSILVFLPGYDDIVICKDKILSDGKFNMKPYHIFTLHGRMQMSDQHKVFNPLKNKRKIILSTNIAESSITIDDVVYVVDCGKVKEKSYDAIVGVCTLQSGWISQACAKQRAGRAGRTQPGICFHLFSRARCLSMQDFPTPEILRIPLHELCLQTKMLAPKDTSISNFLSRALEPPSTMSVRSAINHLKEIEALDENEDVTPLGHHLIDLPVEPRLGKMLIYSVIFRCLDPVLTIVSLLDNRDPFLLPSASSQRSQAIHMRRTFSTNTFSDHMILLRAFQSWQDARVSKSERSFCNQYFISSATMEMIVDIRSQILAQLRACGFVKTRPPGDIRELNTNSNNWAMVKAVLTAGFYPNIAYINKNSMQIRTKREKKVLLHHSSSLREHKTNNTSDHAQSLMKIPSNWLIFEELSRAGTIYNIRSVTNVSPLTIALFIDPANVSSSIESRSPDGQSNGEIILNDWIFFDADHQVLKLIAGLREKMNNLITKKIISPSKTLTMQDLNLIKLISTVLVREDNFLGLFQPPGIGQRPKMFLVNNYPAVNDIIKGSNKTKPSVCKTDKGVPEVLRFKPVMYSHYNQYLPDYVNTPLEPVTTYTPPETPERTSVNSYYDMPNYYYPTDSTNNVNYPQSIPATCDINYIQQNMLMMNLYNGPAKSEYYVNAQYFAQCQSLAIQNDFESNGVNVVDDDELGACALPPEDKTNYQLVNWISTYCNPTYTSYFIIKAGGIKSIDISISKKTWIFSPQTERKLLKLIQGGRIVILIFTVQGSGIFQGIARLLGGPLVNVPDNSQSSLACPVEWLSRADISYNEVRHLFNPSCTDGLELDPEIGSEICLMFTNCQPIVPTQNEPFGTPPAGRAILGGNRL